jgi:hypothetical protein
VRAITLSKRTISSRLSGRDQPQQAGHRKAQAPNAGFPDIRALTRAKVTPSLSFSEYDSICIVAICRERVWMT